VVRECSSTQTIPKLEVKPDTDWSLITGPNDHTIKSPLSESIPFLWGKEEVIVFEHGIEDFDWKTIKPHVTS